MNKKSLVEDKKMLSPVIAIILLVAIAVAITVPLYVYVNGIIGGIPTINPTVNMIQSGDFVSITGMENGPVPGADATAAFVNQTSGATTSATITYTNGNADNADAGDRITKPNLSAETPGVGDKYTVQLMYGGNVVGNCVYTIQ